MPETPTWPQILNDLFERKSRTLWTALPGIVTEYNIDENRATVKPLLKDTPVDGEPEEMPEIPDVPVVWPRVGLAVIYMPMRPGDKVAIFFSTRPLDKWESGDGNDPVDPQDPRHHALSDAFIIPGLYPFGDPIPEPRDPADVRIILYDSSGAPRSQFYLGGDTGDIVMIPENHNKLGAAGASEQAVLGNALLTLFNAHIHQTGVGPSGPPTIPMTVIGHLSPKTYVNKTGDI